MGLAALNVEDLEREREMVFARSRQVLKDIQGFPVLPLQMRMSFVHRSMLNGAVSLSKIQNREGALKRGTGVLVYDKKLGKIVSSATRVVRQKLTFDYTSDLHSWLNAKDSSMLDAIKGYLPESFEGRYLLDSVRCVFAPVFDFPLEYLEEYKSISSVGKSIGGEKFLVHKLDQEKSELNRRNTNEQKLLRDYKINLDSHPLISRGALWDVKVARKSNFLDEDVKGRVDSKLLAWVQSLNVYK